MAKPNSTTVKASLGVPSKPGRPTQEMRDLAWEALCKTGLPLTVALLEEMWKDHRAGKKVYHRDAVELNNHLYKISGRDVTKVSPTDADGNTQGIDSDALDAIVEAEIAKRTLGDGGKK